MSLPKRRHSKTRGRLRRTGDALGLSEIMACPECGAAIEPHRACKKCGAFGTKRNVIKVKREKSKSE